MKTTIQYMLGIVLSVLMASCAYDNYEPPKSYLTGRIVYKGDPILVGYNEVELRLIEPGWVRKNPINVSVAQDGSYSALLFDANYKLYFPSGQGPYRPLLNPETNSDTLLVNVKGSKTMDIEVMPYYMMRNPQFSYNKDTKSVTATFKAEQIITGADAKNIKNVVITLNKTNLINGRESNYNAEKKQYFDARTTEIDGNTLQDLNNITIEGKIPDYFIHPQNYLYARIGVRIEGVEDLIFSPVQKISLQ